MDFPLFSTAYSRRCAPVNGPTPAIRFFFAGFRRAASFDDIVDHCCYAWNTLIDQPWKIMSVARRDWATVGYSM
jgi:hypothetical protein